nr:hypothetical protein [Tanacetum cinerariifolium]
MAKENVPAPTWTNDQLLPVKARLPIEKSNLLMDELCFTLDVDLLRNALGITPKDSVHPFVAPLASDLVIDFVNNVGYPEELHFISKINNIHRRPQSPIHITVDDYPLGNLKFVSKGGMDEVFGRPIPKDLITNAIRNSEYYEKYLKMAARKPCQPKRMTDEEGGKKKKGPPAGKSKQPAHAKQSKPVTEKTFKPTPSKKIRKGKVMKVRKGKRPSTQPQDDTSANVVHDTSSLADSTNDANTAADMEQSTNERTINLDEGQAGSDPGKTPETRPLPEREFIEEDQDGPNLGQSHVAQAGRNPEPMHKDFIAIVYLAVHESLKLTTEEQVHMENPPSSLRTLSSMKNMDDAFTFGDKFLNDKLLKEEPRKANVETKVEYMVTVPIHQASLSAHPLSTLVIDLTPPKPVSPPIQEPIFIATTATTTTKLLPPPPLQQQNITDLDLANHGLQARASRLVFKDQDKQVNEVVKEAIYNALQALLRKCFRDLLEVQMKEILHDRMFENQNDLMNPKGNRVVHDIIKPLPLGGPPGQGLQARASRLVFKDQDKQVNEVVKEAIYNALQALLRKCFRDLLEVQMKEILHDRMFESGSYKSHPDHATLYEALEVSMQHENNNELHEALATS